MGWFDARAAISRRRRREARLDIDGDESIRLETWGPMILSHARLGFQMFQEGPRIRQLPPNARQEKRLAASVGNNQAVFVGNEGVDQRLFVRKRHGRSRRKNRYRHA